MFISVIFLDIILPVPLIYSVPLTIQASKICTGGLIVAPLRAEFKIGLIIEIHDDLDPNIQFIPKPIERLYNDGQVIPRTLFELIMQISFFYLCNIQVIVNTFFPSLPIEEPLLEYTINKRKISKIRKLSPEAEDALLYIQKLSILPLNRLDPQHREGLRWLIQNGLIKLRYTNHISSLSQEILSQYIVPPLTSTEQKMHISQILESIAQNKFKTHVISKYSINEKIASMLEIIIATFNNNKSCLLLVSDINSNTMNMIQALQSNISTPFYFIHNQMTATQKAETWLQIAKTSVSIVIGTKSSVCAPINNLGVIIINEEHERMFKQFHSAPLYNAKDIAALRCKICNSTLILYSNLPNVDTMFKIKQNSIILHEFNQKWLLDNVQVTIINKDTFPKHIITPPLHTSITKCIEQGDQAVIVFNKRGFKRYNICSKHQQSTKCMHCNTILAVHYNNTNNEMYLKCHKCNRQFNKPICTECQTALLTKGIGIQYLETQIRNNFKNASVGRLDSDCTTTEYNDIIHKFKTGHIDILVCTNDMLSKLETTRTTLWSIIEPEYYLHVPDFFSEEKIFYPIFYLINIASNNQRPSSVIIQTGMPNNEIISFAQQKQFDLFIAQQISARKRFMLPPCCSLIKLLFLSESPEMSLHVCSAFHKYLSNIPKAMILTITAMHSDINEQKHTKYSCHFFIKTQQLADVLLVIQKSKNCINSQSCKIIIDPAPVSFL